VSYRSLVHDHQDDYLHAPKTEKKEIARSIVATIRSRGGNFLRKCTDGRVGWTAIGDKKAREKTSQALREGLDAKTLLAKGIVKEDLLAEIAAASEGPPPKRRRRSSDADVATSEARGGAPAATVAAGGVEARKQQQKQEAADTAVIDTSADTVAAAAAAANKATASPELVAEAAPAYYGDMFSLNGSYYAPVSYPMGAHHPGASFYASAASAGAVVGGGAGAFGAGASTPIGASGVAGTGAYNDTTTGLGLDYGTDETDLYASGAREFDVPPPPTAADCTDTAQV